MPQWIINLWELAKLKGPIWIVPNCILSTFWFVFYYYLLYHWYRYWR